MGKNGIKANLDGINKLIRTLKEDYFVRVGIIGTEAKTEHEGSSLTNAEIGTFHEFGTKALPRRSFLEDPLREKLNFKNAAFRKATTKDAWKQTVNKGNQKKFMQNLGAYALKVIADAFEAGGTPEWQPLTERYVKQKERKGLSTNILTATGQLRKSISFKVLEKSKK